MSRVGQSRWGALGGGEDGGGGYLLRGPPGISLVHDGAQSWGAVPKVWEPPVSLVLMQQDTTGAGPQLGAQTGHRRQRGCRAGLVHTRTRAVSRRPALSSRRFPPLLPLPGGKRVPHFSG